jgi:hypothetical protein
MGAVGAKLTLAPARDEAARRHAQLDRLTAENADLRRCLVKTCYGNKDGKRAAQALDELRTREEGYANVGLFVR